MPDAVIVSTARSPIGRAFKGSLTDVRVDELAATPLRAPQERNPEVDFSTVNDVMMGCGFPEGEQGYNVGRNAALLAGIGPSPMISGRIAATCEATIRARGLQPTSRALSSDMTSTAAAPSLSGHAFPAVTVPSSRNAGLSWPSFSSVVPGRGPSSLDTSVPSGVVTGTISRSKWPDSWASTARLCETTAHSSCCSRVTLQRSATFSAVNPIGMYTL